MVSKLNKRLSQLSQNSEELVGIIGFLKAFLLSFTFIFIVGLVFSYSPDDVYPSPEAEAADSRARLLEFSIFGSFLSDNFRNLHPELFEDAEDSEESNKSESGFPDMNNIGNYVMSFFTGSFLKIFSLPFLFWPMWLLACFAGYSTLKKLVSKPIGSGLLDVLGIPNKPFYSGIYAPLRPNGSISCTDLSSPGLACPPLTEPQRAHSHDLARILRRYKAFNQTNLELVRVVLAHEDFPSTVPFEKSVDDIPTEDEDNEGTFVSNKDGTLLESTLMGLPAILAAHLELKQLFKTGAFDQKGPLPFEAVTAGIELKKSKLKDQKFGMLANTLLGHITPARARAISSLPSTLIATAFLACEAGKALVFERSGTEFSRISLYPHLQARAVLHSVQSYHHEYKGDGKLIVRQAIVCSRRHGDFGRAFLPIGMPIQSRAIRDWLEILYCNREQQAHLAELCELEAHLEEIHINFQNGLLEKLESEKGKLPKFWKGFRHKANVLIPLDSMLEVCFQDIEDKRVDHIMSLMKSSRPLFLSLSISSRLPGFKRQAIEAAKFGEGFGETLEQMKKLKGGEKTVARWRIIRRMLTRYNWLSTRVGDDPVPQEGFVRALVLDRSESQFEPSAIKFEHAVPLRNRRFDELLGANWKKEFYQEEISQSDMKICTTLESYEKVVGENKNRAQEVFS